jgi:hypothetical protein
LINGILIVERGYILQVEDATVGSSVGFEDSTLKGDIGAVNAGHHGSLLSLVV